MITYVFPIGYVGLGLLGMLVDTIQVSVIRVCDLTQSKTQFYLKLFESKFDDATVITYSSLRVGPHHEYLDIFTNILNNNHTFGRQNLPQVEQFVLEIFSHVHQYICNNKTISIYVTRFGYMYGYNPLWKSYSNSHINTKFYDQPFIKFRKREQYLNHGIHITTKQRNLKKKVSYTIDGLLYATLRNITDFKQQLKCTCLFPKLCRPVCPGP